MSIDLRIAAATWERLWQLLSRSFRTRGAAETGAIGIVGFSGGSQAAYTVSEMIWPEAGDLKTASNLALSFSGSYIRRAHLKMRQHGLAGLVLVHTHPFADDRVAFSGYDDEEEPQLVANLLDLEPKTHLVSVVAGKSSLQGRVWETSIRSKPMRRAVVVGDTIVIRNLLGQPDPPAPAPEAIFDRGLALTGRGALALLRQMRVVVVGASGTGSLMCEMLVRAGCGELLIIDHDVVKDVNLNRILHATIADAENRSPKVEVLKRGLDAIGLPTTIRALQANVLAKTTCSALREADLIIGCVDRAIPRHLMGKIAMQYLRPYVDVGSEIGGDKNGIIALMARASLIHAGRPCLKCLGVVTDRQLAFESLAQAERARVAKLGYSDDLVINQPAVMDLNAHAAGYGMMLVRHLLQPFLLEPLPSSIFENLVTFSARQQISAKTPDRACSVCRSNPHIGWSDCGPAIGFDPDEVDALSDLDDGVMDRTGSHTP